MAYAALASLAQTTDQILSHHKYSISVDEKEKITCIREYVMFLISFLENFPEKSNHLEGKIRDLANEAEDIMEDFMWKQSRMNGWSFGISTVEFEQQLERVREKFDLICGDMMDDRPEDPPLAAMSSLRLGSMSKNDVVVGLTDDLMAIKDRLCGESSKLEVIPIVGMGGIGKTTLARIAYDDRLITEHFEIRAWVTISQDYRAHDIFTRLLDSMKLMREDKVDKNNECRDENGGVRADELVYRTLYGRRYLIVMDDVWGSNAWDDVRRMLPDVLNGSRIVLTTRELSVAAYADPYSPLHEMKFMDENQSWNLLRQKVFTSNVQEYRPELEDVGKEIARSCRGLPLAVVLVAGILSTIVKTRASWEEIARNVTSITDGQLEKILSLSYTQLPHHLRPCFLFIGVFPQDYKIHVSRLIKLWLAEGFLIGQSGSKNLEDKAQDYLEDLVKRSLVLVTSRKSNGKIKTCSLHDLVRDLCIRKAHEEKFLLHVADRYVLPENMINERRFIITQQGLTNINSPTTHAILCFHSQLDSRALAILGSFRLLRVLDIENHSGFLPSQIFELFHLTYLALGKYVRIPSVISNLENLQTLVIRPRIVSGKYRRGSSYLPPEIWRMPNLRHLILVDYYMFPHPLDASTGATLQNLQTLSGVASLVLSSRTLKMMPNLRKLGIVCFRDQEHHLHNLIHLNQLETLKITMSQSFSWQGHNPVFPRTLTKLTLVGGQLPWKDMNIVGSLPKLEVLKLVDHACHGDTWETTDGEFPELKFLLIEKSNLQCWNTESSHFPKLKCLVLRQCMYLSEIPDCIADILTLERIEVDVVTKSLLDSVRQIQRDLQSYGNDALQVHCIQPDQIIEERSEGLIEHAQIIESSEGLIEHAQIIERLKGLIGHALRCKHQIHREKKRLEGLRRQQREEGLSEGLGLQILVRKMWGEDSLGVRLGLCHRWFGFQLLEDDIRREEENLEGARQLRLQREEGLREQLRLQTILREELRLQGVSLRLLQHALRFIEQIQREEGRLQILLRELLPIEGPRQQCRLLRVRDEDLREEGLTEQFRLQRLQREGLREQLRLQREERPREFRLQRVSLRERSRERRSRE